MVCLGTNPCPKKGKERERTRSGHVIQARFRVEVQRQYEMWGSKQ